MYILHIRSYMHTCLVMCDFACTYLGQKSLAQHQTLDDAVESMLNALVSCKIPSACQKIFCHSFSDFTSPLIYLV